MFDVRQYFRIDAPDKGMLSQIQRVIDNKTKPVGALGILEVLALQIALVQQTVEPSLDNPHMLLFAGDHGVVAEGVSPYPQVVTQQMVRNFIGGGAAVNVFCRQHGITMYVVDAGVNGDLSDLPIIHEKIRLGTRNFTREPAMSSEECQQSLLCGAAIVRARIADGCNVICLGEMGIGNTSSAAAIFSALSGISAAACVGRGTGLDDAGLEAKRQILQRALDTHGKMADPFQILQTFGGFEIAMMCGAMLAASEQRMVVVVDGFIASAAAAVVMALEPAVREYLVFSHLSDEAGHRRLLDYLKVSPLVALGMRLGEGSAAAVTYPLLQSAVGFIKEMASFESASVATAGQ